MTNCKPMDTPIAKGQYLSLEMCPKTPEERNKRARIPYASAIESLMYVMMCTRPDICYAVGLVSRYQSNPGYKHWNAVKRILAYLRATTDYALCYQGGDMRLVGYTDADWGGDIDERKSTLGYAFLLSRGSISWSSKKQTCTALFTMEAEFVACSAAVQEAVWLRRFYEDLDVVTDATQPVTLYCDNQAAIAYTKDPRYHCKSKHKETKYNFVKDIVAQKEIKIQYISTQQMVADPLTKPVTRDVYAIHSRSLGLRRL